MVVVGIPFDGRQGSFLAIVAGMDSMYSSSAVVTALVVDNSSCTFSASGPGVDATRAERSRFSAADVFTAQRSFTLRGKRFSGVAGSLLAVVFPHETASGTAWFGVCAQEHTVIIVVEVQSPFKGGCLQPSVKAMLIVFRRHQDCSTLTCHQTVNAVFHLFALTAS